MTFANIETALGKRLQTMANCPPIAWPNQDFTPQGTYLEFRHSPTARDDNTGTGTQPVQIGIALVTVITPAGGFANAANALAQQIADRFPMGLRLTEGGATVLINQPTEPAPGFTDGAYYRLPVRIRYTTEV